MKKTILALIFLVGAATISYSQCDKNYTMIASKTEFFDGSGNLQRSMEEKSTIEVKGKDIVITHGTNGETMTGVVKYDSCSWKVPFKDGKAVIKTSFTGDGGQNMGVTITIEGKDGKITFLAVPDEDQTRKIKLTIDKFEETK
jgi:hypothetical protein